MTRSLTIRKRRVAKEPLPPPPEDTQSDDLSLIAVPYSSTETSDPPIPLIPVQSPTSPSTVCPSPPPATGPKPKSFTSSVYPDSTHSTVLPGSAHSSILSPSPATETKSPFEVPGVERSLTYAVTTQVSPVWEDIYDTSGTAYQAEPENELPAYLGPHIISSEREEDQPAELFAMPSTPSPPRQATTARIQPVAYSSRPESRIIETQSMMGKKIRRFWGTLRLGRKQSVTPPGSEPPSPMFEHTRSTRLGSNTDTITTEESVATPDGAGPWEGLHVALDGAVAAKEREGGGILDAADEMAGCQTVDQELCHSIAVQIPQDSHFGAEFWGKFPRQFI
ncbi:hypothetical protein E4U41_007708 [Claviceps citrina]|nr:hypothetical protein E4U41_007708 [Claviceps citrina]